jgi:uncharacterized protein with FMN-binding domain
VKRIVLWLLSTVSVLVLLFGYNTSTAGTQSVTPSTSIISGGTSSASGSSSAGTSSASGSPSSGTSSGSDSGTSTVTGDTVSTEWGPVQVELTIADGTITDVSVPVYPNGNGRDIEINNRALPTLIQETLDTQSAGIDMVSGATVTSVGYTTSLQSALDQAGL